MLARVTAEGAGTTSCSLLVACGRDTNTRSTRQRPPRDRRCESLWHTTAHWRLSSKARVLLYRPHAHYPRPPRPRPAPTPTTPPSTSTSLHHHNHRRPRPAITTNHSPPKSSQKKNPRTLRHLRRTTFPHSTFPPSLNSTSSKLRRRPTLKKARRHHQPPRPLLL